MRQGTRRRKLTASAIAFVVFGLHGTTAAGGENCKPFVWSANSATSVSAKLKMPPENTDNDFGKALKGLAKALEGKTTSGIVTKNDSFALCALWYWERDNGDTWGTSGTVRLTYNPFNAEGRNKCNLFVGEILHQCLFGVVNNKNEFVKNDTYTGSGRSTEVLVAEKWFESNGIPKFKKREKQETPALGDICGIKWTDNAGTHYHCGVYLGNYGGVPIYISARDGGTNDAKYGIGVGEAGNVFQQKNGVHIKALGRGKVEVAYWRYLE